MLGDQDWNAIREYTRQVINRENDTVAFYAGRVDRRVDGGIMIWLMPGPNCNLEPDPEDVPPGERYEN